MIREYECGEITGSRLGRRSRTSDGETHTESIMPFRYSFNVVSVYEQIAYKKAQKRHRMQQQRLEVRPWESSRHTENESRNDQNSQKMLEPPIDFQRGISAVSMPIRCWNSSPFDTHYMTI